MRILGGMDKPCLSMPVCVNSCNSCPFVAKFTDCFGVTSRRNKSVPIPVSM